MNKQKYLVVIGGPTASGKTGVAIKIAQHFRTEILSADSRQFYREMSIGTAKPTAKELATVKHHFIACTSIHENLTVGEFERQALALLDQLFQDRDIVVLTGGSGLYIRALCEGLDQFPEVPAEVRIDLIDRFEKEGIEFLQKELAERDPAYYKIVDIHNPQRLIRALEVCIASGVPYSNFRKETHAIRPFKTINIQLEWERATLYDRINQRVELMLKNGLIEEARSLYSLQQLNALQTVGYQELFDYFDNKISLEEATELIKRNTRRYAKRQLTWMRKDGFWKGFKQEKVEEIVAYIEMVLEEGRKA
ncbi:MAG: tRNA dimethylallyltransferase [Saprospiraceae bacterium]|jgi:tRNA dimethylallyltransferase